MTELSRVCTDRSFRREFLNRYALSSECWPSVRAVARLLNWCGIGVGRVDELLDRVEVVDERLISRRPDNQPSNAPGYLLPFQDDRPGWISLGRITPVYRFARSTGRWVEWRLWRPAVTLENQIGTPLEEWDDGFLTVLRDKVRPALHRFAAFNEKLALVAVSVPFTLRQGQGIVAVQTVSDGESLLLGFKNEKALRVSGRAVQELLRPCKETQLEIPGPQKLRELRTLAGNHRETDRTPR